MKKFVKFLIDNHKKENMMLKAIDDVSVRQLLSLEQYIKKIFKAADSSKYNDSEFVYGRTKYAQYTQIKFVYNFLDSDSVYASCSELSNDKNENKMLSINDCQDAYISCFYKGNEDVGDVYSQWLAYCPKGGVSFEFYFGQDNFKTQKHIDTNNIEEYIKEIENDLDNMSKEQKHIFKYSLLCNDSDDSKNYYLYENYPISVFYRDKASLIQNEQIIDSMLQPIRNKLSISNYMVVPYLKDIGFYQEKETRLAFINSGDRLQKCIKFRKNDDGTKTPYIEVKFGDMDLNNRPCEFVKRQRGESERDAVIRRIKEYPLAAKSGKTPIIIPQGYNQEEIYNIVEDVINTEFKDDDYKIICQGHLPITKITLAPTFDSTVHKKKLEIYCKSKYWLRSVEICESKIPYKYINSNH